MKLKQHILLLCILLGSNIARSATPTDSLADAACFTAGALGVPALLAAGLAAGYDYEILYKTFASKIAFLGAIAAGAHMALIRSAQHIRLNETYNITSSIFASSLAAGALGFYCYSEKEATPEAKRTDFTACTITALAALGCGYGTWALASHYGDIIQWLARTNAQLRLTKI